MRERLGTWDVVRRRAGRVGDVKYLFGRGEQKCGFGVDEAADEPRAGNAVDLGPLAGNPAVLAGRGLSVPGQTEFGPTGYPAFEIPRVDAVGAKRRRDTLTYFMAVDAGDDHRALPG